MKALQALRKYGWIQGDTGDKYTGFCSMGAIVFAYKGSKPYTKATAKLTDYISRKYGEQNIIDWNDSINRTRRQVLAAFRAVKI